MSETAKTFRLDILSAEHDIYRGRAAELIFPAMDGGQVGILPGHAAFIGVLSPGELAYKTPDGTWHRYAVSTGSISMANNRCIILPQAAETPEEIDEVRAKEAKERALEALRQKQSIMEYKRTQASLARALTGLKIKGGHYI